MEQQHRDRRNAGRPDRGRRRDTLARQHHALGVAAGHHRGGADFDTGARMRKYDFAGMQRYLDQVVETAGLANTAGFNDDTRAFASIPARHDVWRRVSCNWLAGLAVRGLIDDEDAAEMARECAYGLAKRAYRLSEHETRDMRRET